MQTDILIVGAGVAGLFCALHLPADKQILIISKNKAEDSDSSLAQGGICVLRGDEDYDSYYEDTMRAGHYENSPSAVDVMLRNSRSVIKELIEYGVEFTHENGKLVYTREGAHSIPRILYHEDVTGREITEKLLSRVRDLPNVRILDCCVMHDIIEKDNSCQGVVASLPDGKTDIIKADYTVLACGGIGGLFEHTTNFESITGDALAVALNHGIKLENIDYIQIHPTTLYSKKPGRKFLISESVRGEGAVLYNANHERFVDELLPRDVVTREIYKQMEKDGAPYVWLSMENIPPEEIMNHFPNIYKRCLEEGYDVTKESIPVVPAQHYFMGGIQVDLNSRSSMNRLYAVGETSCNGVHGANRLASNSLLESAVFSKRAAFDIAANYTPVPDQDKAYDLSGYADREAIKKKYKKIVLDEIERIKKTHA